MSKRNKCPDCVTGRLTVRSSREVTSTYRQLVLACDNAEECGGTYGGEQTITHRISPSLAANLSLDLRAAAPRQRAANDNLAGTTALGAPEVAPLGANDNDALGEAIAIGADR